jgi:AcrR family transcriptional regulator
MRLLEAAAKVFGDKGISAATIEDICDEAGFSRGAFYSNFKAKDDLVLVLLEVHLHQNLAEIDRLFDTSVDTENFIQMMESDERRRTDPIKGNGLLYIELVLYALRNPANKPHLVERQRRMYDRTKQILSKIESDAGVPFPGRLDDMAALVLAFDDGVLLHQLVDPESYRPGQYADTMLVLHRLWTGTN